MLIDERWTDDAVIGILIAHLGAFGSGELKSVVQLITLTLKLWLKSTAGLKFINFLHTQMSMKFILLMNVKMLNISWHFNIY